MIVRLFLICIILFGSFATFAQQRLHDEPISDELYEIVKQKTDIIYQGISGQNGNEWSGIYYLGDHHPTVFMWSPDNGFLVTSSLHTFSPSWLNYGKVSFMNNLLTIHPELTKDQKSAHIMATRFVPVKWDKQHFLIPPDEMLDFAYAVHSGSEWAIVNYFAKGDDRDKPRNGLPNLPPEYKKIMTMKAIKARVVDIGKERDLWSKNITIDAGTDKGVVKGMVMYHLEKSGSNMRIRVNEVSERTSAARVYGIGSSGDPDNDATLRVGWEFSSKLPKGLME